MHKGHLTGCAIAFGLALAVFTVTGGSIGGLGLLLAVLICPLTMAVAMWLLMGSQRQGADRRPGAATEPTGLDATGPPR
ncbi:MAG: hypothetical protein ACLGI8_00785 [Acidimicrobiia bacterium]